MKTNVHSPSEKWSKKQKGCAKKARKGENIYKRKDGRWEGRYIKEHDDTNKAIYGYVYAKSYTEVRIKLNKAKATSIIASSKKESFLVFSDWMDIWIEQKRMSVKHSTYMRYKNSLLYEKNNSKKAVIICLFIIL